MPATLARIYRYPVKGLAAEALTSVTVEADGGLPGDRAFGIVRGRAGYDDTHPKWMRKNAFVMLMRDGDESLARLRCAYESDGRLLVVTAPDATSCRADLGTTAGRAAASQVLNTVLGARPDGPVRVVPAGALSLTDIPQNGLSLVNLASVADFAARIGRPVDPMRFRANAYLDGLPAWSEREWIGGTVEVGEVVLTIDAHIHRCNATQVDPTTAARDLDTIRLLQTHYGHVDMGVYASVARGGRLVIGAPVGGGRAAPGTLETSLRRTRFYAKNAWVLARSRLRR